MSTCNNAYVIYISLNNINPAYIVQICSKNDKIIEHIYLIIFSSNQQSIKCTFSQAYKTLIYIVTQDEKPIA